MSLPLISRGIKPTYHLKRAVLTSAACRYSTQRVQKGLVLGFHSKGDAKDADPELVVSKTAQNIDSATSGELLRNLGVSGFKGKQGEVRSLLVTSGNSPYTNIAVVGLGNESAPDNDGVDPQKDSVRQAVAAGVRALRDQGALDVDVDKMSDSRAAAEGASLGLYTFDKLKVPKTRAKPVMVSPLGGEDEQWTRGLHLAEAQNLARELMETPANLLTPTIFAERAEELFHADGHVSVRIHDEAWAVSQNMNAFIAVAKGSEEPLKFVEIEYINAVPGTTAPFVMVGKGITFDSGGISIKPSADMGLMRGDMGGAATVLGTMLGLSRVKAVGRFVALIPLCENMPSGRACKPGDVVVSRAGLSVEIDNTDAEGRLILCDALHYAEEVYKPRALTSVATLTGAIMIALGQGATGVFTSSDKFWSVIQTSGHVTGERMWRMPVYKHYEKQLESSTADLCNIGGREAGSCTAAAFLRKFVTMKDYAHFDIAGVMHSRGGKPGMACTYLGKGMQGRPVRAFIETCMRAPE